MPKAILEFSLPEEQEEYEITRKAHNLYSVITDLNNYFRQIIKYNEPKNKEEKLFIEHIEIVRNKLWQIVDENEISNLF